MADWIDGTLIDPDTHLVFDGIKDGSLVRAQYTYCQGVVVGLETELAVRTGDPRHAARVRRLVPAIAEHMTADGVLRGAGGGDGGLFAGITARYPALPGTTDRTSTGCRCSGRFGTGPLCCHAPRRAPASPSTVRSPNRRPRNVTFRCRFPVGC
jgi:hypothetical protein